jgi:hypothetical protein
MRKHDSARGSSGFNEQSQDPRDVRTKISPEAWNSFGDQQPISEDEFLRPTQMNKLDNADTCEDININRSLSPKKNQTEVTLVERSNLRSTSTASNHSSSSKMNRQKSIGSTDSKNSIDDTKQMVESLPHEHSDAPEIKWC